MTDSLFNELFIRKYNTNAPIVNTIDEFGFATGEVPYFAGYEAKDMAVKDCPGEDGERTFYPDELPLKAYDLEVEFKYCGDVTKIYDKLKSFVYYLTGKDGNGTRMDIYSHYCRIGKRSVWVKSIGNVEFGRMGNEGHIKFKVKFRVPNPLSEVTLVVD